MTKRKLSALAAFLKRVRGATKAKGKQSELARFLGAPRQQVSGWLKGIRAPGGEVTLLMLEWVAAEEAKQQKPKAPGSVRGAAKGKTRKAGTYDQETTKRVRKR